MARLSRENAWNRVDQRSDSSIEEECNQESDRTFKMLRKMIQRKIPLDCLISVYESLEGPFDIAERDIYVEIIENLIRSETIKRRELNAKRRKRRIRAMMKYFCKRHIVLQLRHKAFKQCVMIKILMIKPFKLMAHLQTKARVIHAIKYNCTRRDYYEYMNLFHHNYFGNITTEHDSELISDFTDSNAMRIMIYDTRLDSKLYNIESKLHNISVQADDDMHGEQAAGTKGTTILLSKILHKYFLDQEVYDQYGKRKYDDTSLLYHFEHVVDTLILIYHSTSWKMALLQIKVYLGTILRASFIEQALIILHNIMKPNAPGVETQGAYDDFKQLFGDWKSIYKGEFIQKIIKIICCIISMGFCSMSSIPFCNKQFEKFFDKSGLKDRVWPDIITCIIDSAIYIFDRCITWFKGDCDFLDIIRSPSAAYAYDKELAFIVANVGSYEDNTLEKINIERHEYEKRLEDLQTATKAFYEKASGSERRVMGLNMKELARVQHKVINSTMAMPMREAPFSWALYGLTSVGKTALSNIIVNALMRINGMNPDPKYIVHINAADKYQSELQSWHTVVSVDDLANTKAEHEEGCSTQLVLDYVNNDPKHAIKADVDSKGRVLIKPKLFCVTTNVKRVEAHVKSNEPLSILRRLNIMITVVVKPEFRKPGSHFLDPAKMTEKINDAWTFKVEEAVPLSAIGENSAFEFEVLKYQGKDMDCVSLNTLIKYLGERSKLHFAQQKKLLENVKDVHEEELCEHGSYINICDECRAIIDEPFVETQASLSDYSPHKYLSSLNRKWHQLYEKMPHHVIYNNRFTKVYDWYVGGDDIKTSIKKFRCAVAILIAMFIYICFKLNIRYSIIILGMLILYTHCVAYYTINTIRVTSHKVHAATISSLQPFIEHKYKIMAGMSIPLMVIAVLKMMKPVAHVIMENITVQGNIHVTPQPDAVQKPNEWLKPDVIKPPRTIQVSTTTVEQLTDILKDDLSYAIFSRDCDDRTLKCNIFPLKGNVWIVNHHVVKHNFEYVEIIRRGGAINNNRKCRYHPQSWARINTSDLVLISLPSAGENKDLMPYFPTVSRFFAEPILWMHKNAQCEITYDKFLAAFKDVQFIEKNTGMEYKYPGWHYDLSQNSSVGMCMAPLISRGKFPWILGFHSAGDSSTTFGIGHYVLRGDLEDTYAALFKREIGDDLKVNVEVHSSGDMKLDFPEFNIKHTGEMHKKSPFNFFTEPACALLYGAHNGFRRRFKSEVIPTIISESVEKHLGIAPRHGPPKNIGNWKPWHADASLVTKVLDMDLSILTRAYADFESHIHRFLDTIPNLVDIISPMSMVATLSGVDGCRGIDAIKLSTSAGFPRCKPKRNYVFESLEEYENITRPLEANPEVLAEVARCQKELSQGRRVYFIHRINLKDEPTKLEKEKVRTFAGCTIECLILIRMYFLPIAKLMMDNSEIFECAVGVNAHGPDWTKLTKHMQKHGEDRTIAGDYKSYDSLMWCFLVLLAFLLMIDIAVRCGYSDEDIAIMRGLATELAYGITEYNGEYAGFLAQNYSGHGLTVFINNIVNSLYMRFAYYDILQAIWHKDQKWLDGLKAHLKSENGEAFDMNAFFEEYMKRPPVSDIPPFASMVSLICYGDDNKMSVSRKIQYFNHCTISYSLGRYGITYTMADKESLSVPFIHSSECSFLKRHSVWSDKYQQYLAPLELDSMVKTLHSCLASKVISREQQAYEALDCVIRELWYHGEEVFNDWRNKLQLVLEECDLAGFTKTRALHTFEFLESEYIRKYLCDSDIKNNHASTPIDEIAKNGPMVLETQCCISQEVIIRYKALPSAGIVSYLGQSSPAHKSPPHLGHNSKPNVVSVWIATNNMSNADTVNMTKSMMGAQDHQTVTFRDGTPQWESKIEGAYEETRNVGMDNSVPLAQFFSRPIKYTIPDWVPGSASPYTQIFDPWSVFFNNPRVSNRISNFQLLQATLRVKFMINGNAFYYGRLMVDYAPLAAFRTCDNFNTLSRPNIVTASQRSHIFINPTTSQAGEIHCPFITPRNALSIPLGQWSEMGLIHVREVNPLKHANGSTQNASISCYIWAEDVKLSVPTTNNALNITTQAKDEYGSKPISNMASNIAKYTGQLEKWPIIGPYAKATSMISSAVGNVAKIFGFSRPAQIEDYMQMRPNIVGRLAVTDAGDTCVKLTVDSKQELSIDPRIVGADTKDELDIKAIATKESYLTTFEWTTTRVTDELLWNSRISPMLTVADSSYTTVVRQFPACAFAAFPFNYWRGTMRFRFQIVCSDFHRGRLRFVYDPRSVATTESNVGFNKIVDLCDDKDFTIDISWGQTQSYLGVDTFSSSSAVSRYGTISHGAVADGTFNGVLGVYVLNEITTPNSTVNNDIQINVFISMCDDVEFQVPNNSLRTLTINPQSDDSAVIPDTDNAPVQNASDEGVMSCNVVDHTNDVFFGESITSFRQLMKRYNYYQALLCPTVGRNKWSINKNDFPLYRGQYAYGINTNGVLTYNDVNLTMLNYVSSAFLCRRGGVRWKYLFNSDGDSGIGYTKVERLSANSGITATNTTTPIIDTNATVFAKDQLVGNQGGYTGTHITSVDQQPSLEFECPNYMDVRFVIPKDTLTTSGAFSQWRNSHSVVSVVNSTNKPWYDQWVSAAEDFSLSVFQGAPPMGIYTAP